ncbi:MAG: HmuY family protein [Bacteroidota bacterium]
MKITRIKSIMLFLSTAALVLVSCNDDDAPQSDPFVVAFEHLSANLLEITDEETIRLTYSEAARQSGSISVQVNATNAVYGDDFETVPAATGNTITLPVVSGETENSFTFYKLNSGLDETTSVEFTITAIDLEDGLVQGNTDFLISATASLGGSITPEVGGPNQGNQVFVDLSSGKTTTAERDSWDLGFYGGDEFRVVINGALYMAAGVVAPDAIDIDAITEVDVAALQPLVAVGTFDAASGAYVDAPNGDILQTAIAGISATDEDNNVYLINMGNEVSTETPTPGSVSIAGDARGWKKIRVLRDGEDYILQYADLDDTSHQEITISKNAGHNFTFFSFDTEGVVDVEPERERWDLGFTVFTNIIEGAGPYGYSDFVVHNRKGGVTAYQVTIAEDVTYEGFTANDVDEASFSEDQTTIGSNWRDVFGPAVNDDRFYIIRDSNGNIYKLRFLALTNELGERGYPSFEYNLLQ